MKTLNVFVIALMLFAFQGTVLSQHHQGGGLSTSKKDPAIAAALSLQPLPMDLGSFYAGNWQRGALYTAAEIALFVPAIVLISENSNWWGHHRYDPYYYTDANRRTWTAAERERFYYLVGGYVLVKVISAFDAGYSVERNNAKLSFKYNENARSLAVSLALPIR